jgi:hypothetical protein
MLTKCGDVIEINNRRPYQGNFERIKRKKEGNYILSTL